MSNSDLARLLININQRNLWPILNQLTPIQRDKIQEQLESWDPEVLKEQHDCLFEINSKKEQKWQPYSQIYPSGNLERIKLGQDYLSRGKVGCCIIAGGQATRFGSDLPKGTFPISNIQKKSLFQLFFEKTVAAQKLYQQKLPLAILTSTGNTSITSKFLEENNYFGCDPENVTIFVQDNLPFLNEFGDFLFESIDKLSVGPDGNGGSLSKFVESGIWQKWKDQGIELINYILIDNPLADPWDPEMIGMCAQEEKEVVLKCTDRLFSDEKVGLVAGLIENDLEFLRVVEYSELPDNLLNIQEWEKWKANLSCFTFSMNFIQKVAQKRLTLHRAWKSAPDMYSETNTSMAWKFEKFIFDLLEFAEKTAVLLVPREDCFAPLKNKEGPFGPEEVQAALFLRDQKQYRKVVGIRPPTTLFELSSEFYYPTPDFLKKWKYKKGEGPYFA